MITYNDSVMEIISSKDRSIIIPAKWKIMGDGPLNKDEHLHFWQVSDGKQTKFLVVDDIELAALKVACDLEGVKLNKEESVALTAQQISWLEDMKIQDRSEIDAVIIRAERIDAARTLDELKVELKRSLSIR